MICILRGGAKERGAEEQLRNFALAMGEGATFSYSFPSSLAAEAEQAPSLSSGSVSHLAPQQSLPAITAAPPGHPHPSTPAPHWPAGDYGKRADRCERVFPSRPPGGYASGSCCKVRPPSAVQKAPAVFPRGRPKNLAAASPSFSTHPKAKKISKAATQEPGASQITANMLAEVLQIDIFQLPHIKDKIGNFDEEEPGSCTRGWIKGNSSGNETLTSLIIHPHEPLKRTR